MAYIVCKTDLKLSEKITEHNGFIEYNIDGVKGGRVVVVSQIEEAEKAIEEAEASTVIDCGPYPRGVGLDVEYKATKEKRPGTIQLFFPGVTILLLVSQMEGKFTCLSFF
jgi:hypothetical protein